VSSSVVRNGEVGGLGGLIASDDLDVVVGGLAGTAGDLDHSAAVLEVNIGLQGRVVTALDKEDVAGAGLGGPGNIVPPGVLPDGGRVRVGNLGRSSKSGGREGKSGEGSEDHGRYWYVWVVIRL